MSLRFDYHLYRKLRKSELFSHHPDLMRMMGVHVTVMNVIKTYLSYSSNTLHRQDDVIPLKQKLRMTLSPVGFCKTLLGLIHYSSVSLVDHVLTLVIV